MRIKTLCMLAEALNVSMDYLCGIGNENKVEKAELTIDELAKVKYIESELKAAVCAADNGITGVKPVIESVTKVTKVQINRGEAERYINVTDCNILNVLSAVVLDLMY